MVTPSAEHGHVVWWMDWDTRWLDWDAKEGHRKILDPLNAETRRDRVIHILSPLIIHGYFQCVDVLEHGVKAWDGETTSHLQRITDEWSARDSIKAGDVSIFVADGWQPQSIAWERGALNAIDSAAVQAEWLYQLGYGDDDIKLFDLAQVVENALQDVEPRTVRDETFRLLQPLLRTGRLIPMEGEFPNARPWPGEAANYVARIAEGWPVEAKLWDGPAALWTYFVAGPLVPSR